ncbi:spermidine/putrescine transport system ATP-binding protein [Ancylobacter sp. 3268]|uniref:ABC transporter ATP-binding protein n=1 Tax=Ancylobacter sp. 3268 TaxID=2817752 RepID=UPI0028583605|nr:ABC transporter ATP-binding protein [Ancylobacter sp. 3268]MDR6951420.1 spermidine/putrescine transport system ATP-binding protein [Ancylobacter sp. 3268]
MLQTLPTVSTATAVPPVPILQLVGVRKMFGGFAAVEGIDLDVREGEFLTIVGPSGSGKTTLLRMLAGMDTPSEGNITLRGELINDVPPNKRPTCLVFQSLALFPHKSVGENIAFALKVKGVDAATRKKRALELMRIVRLPDNYHDKNVMKCSGGERQRVALARAFAYDPEVLFFDEPLSALDYKLKKALEKELKDLHRETGKTFIYITHSLEEAMVMSDRIGVMRAGKLVQVGTPEEIYGAPVDRFVSEFVGEVNTLRMKRVGQQWQGVDVPGTFTLAPPQSGAALDEAFVVIRPEYMRFLGPGERADNQLKGTVYNEYSLGSRIQYQVRVGSKEAGEKVMLVELSRARALPPGASREVTIGWDAADAFTLGS